MDSADEPSGQADLEAENRLLRQELARLTVGAPRPAREQARETGPPRLETMPADLWPRVCEYFRPANARALYCSSRRSKQIVLRGSSADQRARWRSQTETMKRLRHELELRSGELEKINTLDAKIAGELASLDLKMESMRREMETFDAAIASGFSAIRARAEAASAEGVEAAPNDASTTKTNSTKKADGCAAPTPRTISM